MASSTKSERKQTKSNPSGKPRSNPGRKKTQQVPRQPKSVLTLLWLLPLVSVFILFWMIFLEMGYIDAQEVIGVTQDQWFMLSFFIIICCIIVLVLPVVGTLMSEAPVAQGTGRAGKADRTRGVIIEAVPEEEEEEVEAIDDKRLSAKAESDTAVKVELEDKSAEEIDTSGKGTKASEKPVKAKVETTAKDDLPKNIVIYPTKVGSGLYGDTYIKLNSDKLLKLRTILFDEKNLY